MLDKLLFEQKMKAGKLLGITIVSPGQLCKGIGFTGTYKHVYGSTLKEEITDAAVLAIAEELKALQVTSRLLVGKFFYATMNFSDGKMVAEIFYDDQFSGQDYISEMHHKFLRLMKRYAEWMDAAEAHQ